MEAGLEVVWDFETCVSRSDNGEEIRIRNLQSRFSRRLTVSTTRLSHSHSTTGNEELFSSVPSTPYEKSKSGGSRHEEMRHRFMRRVQPLS